MIAPCGISPAEDEGFRRFAKSAGANSMHKRLPSSDQW
jgi:hypothetical protein